MARHTRTSRAGRAVSLQRALVVGLVGASFALLASCESGTEPTLDRRAQLSIRQHGSADDQEPNVTVIVGTGNPSVDVPAVQAAVDQGGAILRRRSFCDDH